MYHVYGMKIDQSFHGNKHKLCFVLKRLFIPLKLDMLLLVFTSYAESPCKLNIVATSLLG